MEGSNDVKKNNSRLMAVTKTRRTNNVSLEAKRDVASGDNWTEAVIWEAVGVMESNSSVVLFWLTSDAQIGDPP